MRWNWISSVCYGCFGKLWKTKDSRQKKTIDGVTGWKLTFTNSSYFFEHNVRILENIHNWSIYYNAVTIIICYKNQNHVYCLRYENTFLFYHGRTVIRNTFKAEFDGRVDTRRCRLTQNNLQMVTRQNKNNIVLIENIFEYLFQHYNKYCSCFSFFAHDIFLKRSIFNCVAPFIPSQNPFARPSAPWICVIVFGSLSWPHRISRNEKSCALLSQWYPGTSGSAVRWPSSFWRGRSRLSVYVRHVFENWPKN